MAVTLVSLAALTSAGGCGDRGDRSPFDSRAPSDPEANAVVARLEAAVNARDPAAICLLYQYPSGVCMPVWRARLARLRIPVQLHVLYVEGSCNAAPRATLRRHLARDRINSVTWVHELGSIFEVGVGMRRSGLTIPRYGSCDDSAVWDGGDPVCDEAGVEGYEDEFHECKPKT